MDGSITFSVFWVSMWVGRFGGGTSVDNWSTGVEWGGGGVEGRHNRGKYPDFRCCEVYICGLSLHLLLPSPVKKNPIPCRRE